MAIAEFEDLDFDAFHRRELPKRLAAGNGAAVVGAVERLGSLALRLTGGGAYTYAAESGGIAVSPGDEAADTVIELDLESWEGLVHDYESPPGLLYAGRTRCLRGDAMKLVLWEPGLRAMYTGRPVFDPEMAAPRDRQGRPLDVEWSFRLGDDREDMAHFLRTAGYLLLRDVFDAAEIAGFLEEAQELRGEAVKGDKLSWWGRNDRGEDVLCRVTRAAAKPRLASLATDSRLLGVVDLADERLVWRVGEGNGVTVIYKNPAMSEGLSDIPWHRDCGMGGHSVMCPVLLASVFLTPATPETGDLRFLPGSWQASYGFRDATDPAAPRGAHFAARPGDVSFHYGDVVHAAPPPSRTDLESYRISAVTGFARPESRNHRGATSYNDVLHGREDGQVEHLARVAKRS